MGTAVEAGLSAGLSGAAGASLACIAMHFCCRTPGGKIMKCPEELGEGTLWVLVEKLGIL